MEWNVTRARNEKDAKNGFCQLNGDKMGTAWHSKVLTSETEPMA